MTTLLPRALIVKEGRALTPIWLGTAVTIVAGTQAGMLQGALLAFILGSAALGVFSIGHEYGNRTLTSLLAQPLARSRLLLSKVVVLASLLVLLSLVAAFVLFRADGIERVLGGGAHAPVVSADQGDIGRLVALAPQLADATLVSRWQLAIIVLTPLLGLCVAPWLTMVFRNVTAGLVFTLAIPSALWIAGQIGRAASVNFDFIDLEVGSPFGYGPALVLMIAGMLIACLIAAVHGRLLFAGLEALDTPRDLRPSALKRRPRATAAAVTSHTDGHRRGPLLLFVQKEMRLYGLAFVLAALYASGWIALWLVRADAYLADDSFQFFAAAYGLFIALLVGGISVAEERALRTFDTQLLQPWAFWKQWLAKFATVSVMTLLLGLALPRVLQAAWPLVESSRPIGPDPGSYFRFVLPNPLNGGVAMMVLTTLFSGYVSTMCIGGLRALLVALSSSFGLTSLYVGVLTGVARLDDAIIRHLYGPLEQPCRPAARITWAACWRPWWDALSTVSNSDFTMVYLYQRTTITIAFVMFAALLLLLYLRNSRSGEPGMTMAKRQLPTLAIYVALAAVVFRGGEGLLRFWLFTH